jgi:hypothetical protein
MPSQTFPVIVTCGSVITNFNLLEGIPQSVGNIPLNTSCTVVEPPPTLPANVCPLNKTAVWSTAYAPPSPVTITGVTTTVTVTNTLDCVLTGGGGGGSGGSLLVRKQVTNNTTAEIDGFTYPAVVSCVSGTSPATVTNVGLGLNSPHTMNNLPLGGICTVAETQPPAPTNGCEKDFAPVWAAPVYTPASATIGTDPVILVQNTLNCQRGGKSKIGPPSCDPRTTSKRGNDCACRYPAMVKSSATACTCGGGMNFVPGKGCARPLECSAPMVPNSAGTACACPPGSVQRGRECARPVTCNPPAKLNSRGACQCPADTVAKGNTCVPRERRGPSITPGDAIKVVPGLFGPGRGGPSPSGPRPGGPTPGGPTPGGPAGGAGPRL